MNIPAFCDNENCRTVFPSGFVFSNVANATFSGNKSGPCPRCGGMGHVPDGIFNFVGETIEIISAPEKTLDDFLKFSKIIREAYEQKQSFEMVAQNIKEKTPSFSKILDLLPDNKSDWYTFIGTLVAIVALISQQRTTRANVDKQVTVSQVIEYISAKSTVENNQKSIQVTTVTKKNKIGRNEPCFCGSGIKHKRCHGK